MSTKRGNQSVWPVVGRVLGLLAVFAVVAGLGIALEPRPAAPVLSSSEQTQDALSATSGDLALQLKGTQAGSAGLLAGAREPQHRALSQLATVLTEQEESIRRAGSAPVSPASESASSGTTAASTLSSFLTETLHSVSELTTQARSEKNPGLSRLYASAALGRALALNPLLTADQQGELAAFFDSPVPTPGGSAADPSAPAAPGDSPTSTPTGSESASGTSASCAAQGNSETSGSSGSPASQAAALTLLQSSARYGGYLVSIAAARTPGPTPTSLRSLSEWFDATDRQAQLHLENACAPLAPIPAGYPLPSGFTADPGSAINDSISRVLVTSLDVVAEGTPGQRIWALKTAHAALGSLSLAQSPVPGSAALPGLVPDALRTTGTTSPAPAGTTSAPAGK